MNTLVKVAEVVARLIHTVAHLADVVEGHGGRIANLEDQVAALQEHMLDREEVSG